MSSRLKPLFRGVRFLISVLAVASLSGGCVRFEPKPLIPAQEAIRLDSRTLTDPQLERVIRQSLPDAVTQWPLKTWNLEELTVAAFYFHPSLEVARAQWRTAMAGIESAGERPNPVVALTPGYNFSSASSISPWLMVATLDVPLETAGKRGKRIAEAHHAAEAARCNIAAVAWQVRKSLRSALLDCVVASNRLALLNGQVQAEREALQLVRGRLQAGALSSADLFPAQVTLSKAEVDLAAAQTEAVQARSHLAQSLGLSLSAISDLNTEFPLKQAPADQLTSAKARSTALQSRADIRAALEEYAAAEAQLRLQIAKQYPDAHLNPGYEYDQGDDKWSLGLSLDLPIFSRNRGPILEAQAKREEKAARFLELQAGVIAEIDRATAVLKVTAKEARASALAVEAQRGQLASIQGQLNAGAVDRLELIRATIEEQAASLAALEAQRRYQQALGELEAAVQRPLTSLGPDPDSLLERKSK